MTTTTELSIETMPLDGAAFGRPAPICLARLAIEWAHVVAFLAPVGHEDEWGFHYGEENRSR